MAVDGLKRFIVDEIVEVAVARFEVQSRLNCEAVAQVDINGCTYSESGTPLCMVPGNCGECFIVVGG